MVPLSRPDVSWEPWAAVCGYEDGTARQEAGERRGGDRFSGADGWSLPAGGLGDEEVASGDRRLELPQLFFKYFLIEV